MRKNVSSARTGTSRLRPIFRLTISPRLMRFTIVRGETLIRRAASSTLTASSPFIFSSRCRTFALSVSGRSKDCKHFLLTSFSILMYIGSMTPRQMLGADRQRVAAMAAWLNGDQWRDSCYMLPDGSVFPQREPQPVLEQARRWVSDVLAFRWDLQRWREKHSGDWQHINDGFGLYRPSLSLGLGGKPMYWFEHVEAVALPPHWWAFAELVMNPERDRLGRCQRCQRFYVSEGRYKRQRFCSWRCAHAVAASRYVGRRYAAYRQQRLELAQRLLPGWRPRFGDWKAWLVKRAGHSPVSLTRNFLTRCVFQRKLTPPTEPSKKGLQQ